MNCPDARALAGFYAAITGGEVTFSHPAWATVITPGGRIDVQTVGATKLPGGQAMRGDPVGHPFCLTTVDELG